MSKTTATTPANIYIALAAIIQAINAIPKDKRNEGQNFKFRGIDDCYNTLHTIFASNGVVCVPVVEKLETSDYQNAKGNKVFRSVVYVAYNFTAADGTAVTSKVVGEAFDFGDKATNKAMSAAHKYLLLQTFLIPTHDIADADAENFNFDAGAAARQQPGAEYENKTLAELTALRNTIIESGQTPPAPLLGKIAELRATEEDANLALGPQKPGIVAPAAEKAPETAPAAQKKGNGKKAATKEPEKKPEPPVVEAEVVPPAAELEPEPQQEEMGFEEAQPETNLLDHVIVGMKHKDYEGKKVGSFSAEQVRVAVEKWARNPSNAVSIAADPARQADVKALEFAYAQWEKSGAYAK